MNLLTDQTIGKAAHEITTMDVTTIEQNTAISWGSRAIAAYREGQKAGFKTRKGIEWLIQAALYKHEAIEHASQVNADFLASMCDDLSEVPY